MDKTSAASRGTAPPVTARRVIVEYASGDLLAMDEGGDVKAFADPAAVVRWVKRTDAARSRRADAITVTQLEWRGMPAGFVPPGL